MNGFGPAPHSKRAAPERRVADGLQKIGLLSVEMSDAMAIVR